MEKIKSKFNIKPESIDTKTWEKPIKKDENFISTSNEAKGCRLLCCENGHDSIKGYQEKGVIDGIPVDDRRIGKKLLLRHIQDIKDKKK